MYYAIKSTALCLFLVGCAAGPATTSASATTAAKLDADTPVTTPSGATFEAPKNWFITRGADRITLQDPEKDLTATMFESNEQDPAKAIAAAWQKVQPGFARKIAQSVTPPPKNGWDSITQTVYETGGEGRVVIGVARRKGNVQYVLVLDADQAGLERRGVQFQTVVDTFKAAGISEESLAKNGIHAFDAERQKRFVSFVEKAMHDTDVPGAAIAVVEHGKVSWSKGVGVKEKGKSEAVSPDTLFMIGSTTKSLTTLMMARLVDEKKFSWSTPVAELYPSFALGDAETTKKVTMRHTVCACTGLPRQDLDFLFEYANSTPEGRIASMKTMKPTTGFGETFQYSNLMVATGGYVAAHVREPRKPIAAAYADAMQALVFDPLGMKTSTLSIDTALARNHATPHGKTLKADVNPMPITDEGGVEAVGAAGGIWSSANELASFVAMELNNGHDAKGNRLVSEENLLARRKPQIKISDKASYGLGFFLGNDHGVPIVHHGGNTLGFTSDMFFLPEHGVGVVVLTNAGSANTLRGVIRRRFLELVFDGKEEAADSLGFAVTETKKAIALENAKVGFDHDLANQVAGTYSAPGLGKVTVSANGTFDAGEWKTPFGTKREDDGTQRIVLLGPPLTGLDFKVVGKTLVIELGQDKRVLTRQTP